MAKKNKLKILQSFSKLTKERKRRLLVIMATLLIVATLYLTRSLFVAAIVNGRPISRLTVVKDLESQGGKQVLDSHIDQALVNQEITSRNINISQETVDEELRRIEELLKGQNLTLDAALEMRGQTREDLIAEIKRQKAIEEILSEKITVSEEEISKHYEENKDFLEPGKKFEELKDEIRQSVYQQKLASEYESWVADLRAKAKIIYFVNF